MDKIDALATLLPEGAGSRIRSIFDAMEIAEEEIAAAGDRPGLFLALAPPPGLSGRPDWLVRAHMRELCQRPAGEDLDRGTLVEALLVLEGTTLRHPVHADVSLTYCRTARRVMELLGDDAPDGFPNVTVEEATRVWGTQSTPDALDEWEQEARRKGGAIRVAARG